MRFTAIIEKSADGWFVGQIEEVPAAISQGRTLEELRENLLDALNLLSETNKSLVEKEHEGRVFTKEFLKVA